VTGTEVTGADSAVAVAIERVGGVEERLCRLLAGGWRNAADDLTELATDAEVLTDLGLTEVAARLRALTVATRATDGLRALSLALTACRLVRLRLAPDSPPNGTTWAPVVDGSRKAATSRLLPLARFATESGEVWSCLWLQGGFGIKWVLVEPPRTAAGGEVGELVSWLVRPITGRLRWRKRLPLSAGGDVEVCALEEPTWVKPYAANEHPLAILMTALHTGKLDANAWLGYGALRLLPFDPDQLGAYVWPDAAAPALLATARGRLAETWTLAMTAPGVIPIAVVAPGPPRVLHLLPELPTDPVANAL
jgi:hypothetical protein